MTIEEAATLVLQAGAMTVSQPREGNTAPVYLLEMGEAIKIFDLALKMIELSGMKLKDSESESGDIEIKIIGLKEGEKLNEELLIAQNDLATSHEKIRVAQENSKNFKNISRLVDELKQCIHHGDEKSLKELLFRITNSNL